MGRNKLIYLRQGKTGPKFKMFLRGLFLKGYDVKLIEDPKELAPLLCEAQFKCVVALSGCSKYDLPMIEHMIKNSDPAGGTDMRIIVMSYPDDPMQVWKRQSFNEVATSPEELVALLEKYGNSQYAA